jgi:hypothetical protein
VTETPPNPGALRILSQRNRRTRGWPAGAAAWDPGYLARLMRAGPPGVLYVQPDGHNPTGATMPGPARETIARTAAAGWLITADETIRPLHLAGNMAASLAADDHRVIVVSSLSKTVWGWGLGFRQSSLGHIARVLRHPALDASRPPPLSWHAAFPLGFRLKVGQGDPWTSFRIHPGCTGDTARRLTAHAWHDRRSRGAFRRGRSCGETSSTRAPRPCPGSPVPPRVCPDAAVWARQSTNIRTYFSEITSIRPRPRRPSTRTTWTGSTSPVTDRRPSRGGPRGRRVGSGNH